MKKILFGLITFLILCFNCNALEVNNISNTDVKYFKSVNYYGKEVSYEITKEEYDNVNKNQLCGSFFGTAYKSLSLINTGSSVILELEWKSSPTYQSYDVIAIRGENVIFDASSIYGIQQFVKNGETDFVTYNKSTTNTKIFSNGIGISMNLVDNSTYYRLRLSVSYTKKSTNGSIYGSYQHATQNVTLAQSQNYNISSNGYGKVIEFNNSVKNIYDGMNGVNVTV